MGIRSPFAGVVLSLLRALYIQRLFLCSATALLFCSSLSSQVVTNLNSQGVGVLGTAYNSTSEVFLGQECVTAKSHNGKDYQETGEQSSSFSLMQSMSANEAASALGFSLDARARYGAIEGSAAAKFLQQSESNAFSVSAIYSSEYKLKVRKLNYKGLSDIGNSVTTSGTWATTCGDAFVNEITPGGRLFISVRVDFSSERQKQEFQGSFSLSGPVGSVSASLQNATAQFGSNVKVAVSAYQIGGDTTKLTAILTKGGGKDLQAYTECTLGKFESCATFIQTALSYAADTASGFPAQLSEADKGGPGILAYRVLPYSSLGLRPGVPQQVGQAAQLGREHLAGLFEKQYRLYVTADRLFAGTLLKPHYEQLKVQQGLVAQNIRSILEASNTCYNEYAKCFDAANRPELVKEVMETTFMPDSFSSLCVTIPDLDETDPLRSTINTLIEVVQPGGTVNGVSRSADCSNYESRLSRLKVMEFNKKNQVPISTLAPFAAFTGLKRLDIAYQDLSDLSGLSSLNNLEILYLQGNKITDLRPLEGLASLKQLDLDSNRIKDVSPLKGAELLEWLSLASNLIVDISPLQSLTRLTYLHLQHNNIQLLPEFNPPNRLETIVLLGNYIPDKQVVRFGLIHPQTKIIIEPIDFLTTDK